MSAGAHDLGGGHRPHDQTGVRLQRSTVVETLHRAGYDASEIDRVLDGLSFPVPLEELERHGQRFGLSPGTLTERMGGSP